MNKLAVIMAILLFIPQAFALSLKDLAPKNLKKDLERADSQKEQQIYHEMKNQSNNYRTDRGQTGFNRQVLLKYRDAYRDHDENGNILE